MHRTVMIMYKISNFDLIKNQLKDLESDVNNLKLNDDIPQLIDKTNLLRENEILKKLNDKKSQILDACFSYVDILEQLVQSPKTKTQPKKSKKQTKIRKNSRKRLQIKNKRIKKITRKTKKKVKKKTRKK